jgi:short-subunit dehydrogenase
LVIAGDLTVTGIRERFVSAALQEFGRVDVLINNAGVGLYANPTDVPIELARKLMELNVLTPLALAQMVTPGMRSRKSGAIVNVGSVGGHVALPWAAIYCASKFALHALSDSLRRELKLDGVHVMKVCPGIVRTDFRKHVLAGQAPEKVEGIRRTVSPAEVASAIACGLEAERSLVYVPHIWRLFRALDFFVPKMMDWFIETKARAVEGRCHDTELATRG